MILADRICRRLDAEDAERARAEACLDAPLDLDELSARIETEEARIVVLETELAQARTALERACDDDRAAIEALAEARAAELRADTVREALRVLSGLELVRPDAPLADLPRMLPQVVARAEELRAAILERLGEIERARETDRVTRGEAPDTLEREAHVAWTALESALTPAAGALRRPVLREGAWALDARELRRLLRGPVAELARDAAVERELGLDEEPAELRGLVR